MYVDPGSSVVVGILQLLTACKLVWRIILIVLYQSACLRLKYLNVECTWFNRILVSLHWDLKVHLMSSLEVWYHLVGEFWLLLICCDFVLLRIYTNGMNYLHLWFWNLFDMWSQWATLPFFMRSVIILLPLNLEKFMSYAWLCVIYLRIVTSQFLFRCYLETYASLHSVVCSMAVESYMIYFCESIDSWLIHFHNYWI